MQSYKYIKAIKDIREKDDRKMIRLPDDCKEYLSIYTTEYEDSYILEAIEAGM